MNLSSMAVLNPFLLFQYLATILVLAIIMLNLNYFNCYFIVSNPWLQKDPHRWIKTCWKIPKPHSSPKGMFSSGDFPSFLNFLCSYLGSNPLFSLPKPPEKLHFPLLLQLALWLSSSQWKGNGNDIISFPAWCLKASHKIPHNSLWLWW